MKLDIFRITEKDIPEIDDPEDVISPEYKAVRKCFYSGEQVKWVQVRKHENGQFSVDIAYSTPPVVQEMKGKERMKDWVKKGLEDFVKTGVCPYCGFGTNELLRWHNINEECELMNNVKIKELLDSTPPATAERKV